MTRRGVLIALAFGVAAGAGPLGPASAHHGWSGYDSSKTLNLTGTIKESGYEHPHGFVKFEVPGLNGGDAITVETLPSAIAAREAYTKDGDIQQNTRTKDDVAWITGAWGPEDRPGICAVAAQWRLVGEKAELFLWEEAKECPKDALPKYEAKVDKKPPPLVQK